MATAIEYGLIAALIGVVVITASAVIKDKLHPENTVQPGHYVSMSIDGMVVCEADGVKWTAPREGNDVVCRMSGKP